MKYTGTNPYGLNQTGTGSVSISVENQEVASLTTSSLFISGSVTASSGFTGSLFGTSSYAVQALSASYAVSASHEIIKEVSSSHADFADSASFASTASYVATASYTPTLDEVTTAGATTTNTVNTGTLVSTGGGVTARNSSAAGVLRVDRTDGKIASLIAGGSFTGFYFDQTGGFGIQGVSRTTAEGTTYPAISDFLINGSTGNVLIGTTTDGAKLRVKGSGTASSTTALRVENANASASLEVRDDKSILFAGSNGVFNSNQSGTYLDSNGTLRIQRSINGATYGLRVWNGAGWSGHDAIHGLSYRYPIYGVQGGNGGEQASPLSAGAAVHGKGGVGVYGRGVTPSGDTGAIGVMATTLYVKSNGNTTDYNRSASAHIIGLTTITGSTSISGETNIYKSGSTVLTVEGSQGSLMTVEDSLTGSLMSVGNISGLPLLEVFDDGNINAGKYNVYPIKIVDTGSRAVITGSISSAETASYVNPLVQDVEITGSLTVSGSSTLTNIGPTVLSGSTTTQGNMTVNGTHTINGQANINIGGNYFRLTGAVGGQITYGYASYFGTYYFAGWTALSSSTNVGLQSGPTGRLFLGNGNNPDLMIYGNKISIGSFNTPTAKLQIKGSGTTSSTTALRVENANASGSLVVLDDGKVGIGTSPSTTLHISNNKPILRLSNLGGTTNITQSPTLEFRRGTSLFSQIYINPSAADLIIEAYGEGSGGSSTKAIIFKRNGVEISKVTGEGFEITGSLKTTNGITNTGSVGILGETTLYKSGSTVLDVQGSQGQLFSVVDELSGSLMSVNDISGLPILEVFSDDRVEMGTYGAPGLVVSGSSFYGTGSIFGTASYVPTLDEVTTAGNTTTNSISIGTNSTPSEKLVIDGSLLVDRTDGSHGQVMVKGGGQYGKLATGGGGNTYFAWDGAYFDFRAGDGGGSSQNALRLDSNKRAFFYNNVLIGTTTDGAKLRVKGSGTTSSATALRVENANASPSLVVLDDGNVGIGTATPSYRLDISGSGNFTDSLTVTGSVGIAGETSIYKSGSTVLTVEGSQGELFAITDSLSGSLFTVGNISGLPILEVFSDNTTLIGDYLAPALVTTKKVTADSGSTVIYSLPTASYDGAFFDYTIKSGSNARAGSIFSTYINTTVSYADNSTSDIGDTSGFEFGVILSGSNMVLTGSASTDAWTVKTIIRSI